MSPTVPDCLLNVSQWRGGKTENGHVQYLGHPVSQCLTFKDIYIRCRSICSTSAAWEYTRAITIGIASLQDSVG